MAHNPDVDFTKRRFSLQQIIKRRPEFPIIARTCNKLLSFKDVPIEEEGKIIFIESETALTYARIKVLKIPEENKVTLEREVDFEGEEFYVPLGCPGKLRIVPYPGTRRRYVNVSEVMKENPRYLQAIDDIMAVPPRHVTDNCLTCIPTGTIIEPKTIVQHNRVRYLKCVDSKGRCLYLREDCPANFTSVQDVKEYTLRHIWDAGFLLPKSIQFVPGTISPYDVVLFHDDMASNNLIITNCPLEVLEIITFKTLITRVRESERCCFKTLLLPQTIYKTFHVQEAEFRTLELKSRFVERKFGGCHGDNDFIFSKMYLMPASGELVCWLRNPIPSTKDDQFYESSDSDSGSDYEIPGKQLLSNAEIPGKQLLSNAEMPSPLPESSDSNSDYEIPEFEIPPPLPDKDHIKNQEQCSEMHTMILLPKVQIQDRDALQKVKDRTKLGFGKVHGELKRIFKTNKRKKTRPMSDSSIQAITHSNKGSENPIKASSKQVLKELRLSKSMEEASTSFQTSENKSKHVHCKRPACPLPSLPPRISDDETDDYSYVEVPEELPHLPVNIEGKKKTARVDPISFTTKSDTNIKPTALTSPVQRKPEAYKLGLDNRQLKRETPFPRSPTNDSADATLETCKDYEDCVLPIESNSENVNENPSHLTNMNFFTYSIEETTACLKYCGLEKIADICNEQKLDGDFFKHADEAEVKESLNLSALDVLKLKKIYNGWRPKYT